MRRRVKECDPPPVVKHRRIHFNTIARGDLLRSAAIRTYSPQMASIDIVLVSRKYYEGFIGRERYVLHLKLSGSQRGQCAAVGRNRIEMHPAISLRRKQQAITGHPLPEIVSGQAPKGIGIQITGAPDLFAFTRLRIDYPNRPRLQTLAVERKRVRHIEQPHESNAPTIRRPARAYIAIDAGREEAQPIRTCVKDCDETVIAAR